MRAPLIAAFAAAALAAGATACVDAPDDAPVPDDAEFGDSLPEGKLDGYTVPVSLGLDKNRVLYLTFDDGPSPTLTPKILDVLARHGVPATFFVTGVNIAGNEAILRRARDEGHIIANHQWRHVVASLDQFRAWVRLERDLIRDVVGPMPLYFRYPYGAMTADKERVLEEEGYVDGGVGWDIDTLDWDFGPDGRASRAEVPAALKNDFVGWVVYQAERRGGGVVLFHDVQSITAERLDTILARLKARGFRFAQLPRERGGSGGGSTGGASGFIGDPCASDADCTFAGGFCLTGSEAPGGYCTRTCTSTCPDRAGYPTTRCVRAPDANGGGIDVCAVGCGAGGTCRTGYACQTLSSPSGAARNVCWAD